MADNSKHGSDAGAAFMGLFGGALFIGIIIYGIVLWTNSRFAGHENGGETSALVVDTRAVA